MEPSKSIIQKHYELQASGVVYKNFTVQYEVGDLTEDNKDNYDITEEIYRPTAIGFTRATIIDTTVREFFHYEYRIGNREAKRPSLWRSVISHLNGIKKTFNFGI
jgi:hypothetical protein